MEPAAPCLSAPVPRSRPLSAACDANDPMQQRSFSKRTMTVLFSTLTKGRCAPDHHSKHAPATPRKNESKFYVSLCKLRCN